MDFSCINDNTAGQVNAVYIKRMYVNSNFNMMSRPLLCSLVMLNGANMSLEQE